MSNSNSYLVGRVALVIWASGVILVLGGCGAGFGVGPTSPAVREQVLVEQKACEARLAAEREADNKDFAAAMEDLPSLPPHPTDAERQQWIEKMQEKTQAMERSQRPFRSTNCLREAKKKVEALHAGEWQTPLVERDVYDDYNTCLKRADLRHEEYLVFMKKWYAAHPEVTFTQLGNILQQHGKELQQQEIGNLKGMTTKEKFQLWMRIENDKNRTEWKMCETTLQTQLEIQADVDREIQRLQPRLLYIVP